MATSKSRFPHCTENRRLLLAGAALFVLALVAFLPAVANQFVNFDDLDYITQNPHVTSGLNAANVAWAFTTFHAANWHPLTWLSHMLDVQLFGMNAWGHHLTNILLHAANTTLLFLFLFRASGAFWRSVLVAALFGVHPLHVESVAWASERKDVLSTFFLLLTLIAYARYSRMAGWKPYLITVGLFAAGLMAKPMLVTLPFLLLLLDYWPLGRLRRLHDTVPDGASAERPVVPLNRLVLEKMPFLALAFASSIVTIYAQRAKAMASLENLPLADRVANALVSYAGYLGKMLWPVRLAAFYPLPDGIDVARAVGAGVLLAVISLFVVLRLRRSPWLLTGWGWYLGTLVPVIGLVQVGMQAMADRYTYVPLIGLFIIISWGGAELVERFAIPRYARVIAAGALLAALAAGSAVQATYWRDTVTLFRHATAVTKDNWYAHTSLGMALDGQGKRDEALAHFHEALRLNPGYGKAHYGLGVLLGRLGRHDEALAHYREAVRLSPELVEAHSNLASALAARGEIDEAVCVLAGAVGLAPEDPKLHYNLAVNLETLNRYDEAIAEYREALRLRPDYAAPHNNLGFIFVQTGRTGEAVFHLSEAVRLNPELAAAREELDRLRSTPAWQQ